MDVMVPDSSETAWTGKNGTGKEGRLDVGGFLRIEIVQSRRT